jgi:hypothetical protein
VEEVDIAVAVVADSDVVVVGGAENAVGAAAAVHSVVGAADMDCIDCVVVAVGGGAAAAVDADAAVSGHPHPVLRQVGSERVADETTQQESW